MATGTNDGGIKGHCNISPIRDLACRQPAQNFFQPKNVGNLQNFLWAANLAFPDAEALLPLHHLRIDNILSVRQRSHQIIQR